MSEIVTVQITDLSRAGSGVARLQSGEVVFVPYTAPGDEVRVEITGREKNYLHGRLIEILRPSPSRVIPVCSVFGTCGGCSWQHLPYELQFETKKKGLLHALKRSGVQTDGIPLDPLPAANPLHYRNRVQLRGSVGRKSLGFFARGSQEVVPIDSCSIADERINQSLPALLEQGLREQRRDFKLEVGLDEAGGLQTAWNQGHAALGFRQVNDAQNRHLQEWVARHLKPAETLLDLYGGSGNLSLGIADRHRAVHCVDVRVPKQSPFPHFQFHRGEVARWLERVEPIHGTVSVILDPPREGLGRDFSTISNALREMEIVSMALVGCDVDSFVRDTHRFLKAGYRLERVGVLDLFPQTPHVESLALFSR